MIRLKPWQVIAINALACLGMGYMLFQQAQRHSLDLMSIIMLLAIVWNVSIIFGTLKRR